jgi:hypothetical protein
MRILLDERDIFTLVLSTAIFHIARKFFSVKEQDADSTIARLFSWTRGSLEATRYKQITYQKGRYALGIR